MKNKIMTTTVMGLLAAAMAATLQAQTTYTWTSPTTGTGNWSVATWSPSTPPAGGLLGDTLNFANGTYTANNDLTGLFTLTTLNCNTGSGALTLSGNDLDFEGGTGYDVRLNNNSTGPIIVNNNLTTGGTHHWYISPTPGGSITLNGVVSGGLGIGTYVTGGGQAIFANANNSFTNAVAVLDSGSLVAGVNSPNGGPGAFGNSTVSIQLPSSSGESSTVGVYGGAAGITIGQRINATALMGAGGTRIIGGLNTSGWVTFPNYIDGPNGQTMVLYAASGGGVQFNNGVLGAPANTTSLVYDGGGQFSIYAAGAGGNTYSGTTTVRNGIVYLNGNDTGSAGNYSLGSSPVSTAVQLGDSSTPAGATVSLLTGGGSPVTISHNISVNNYGGNMVIGSGSSYPAFFTGNINLQKSVYVQDYADHVFDSVYSGQISGPGGIITTGEGTIDLTANNTYSGGTIVQGGDEIDADADGALGTGGVTLNSGATLVLENGVANSYISSTASLLLQDSTSLVNLNYSGTNNIAGISFDGGITWVADGTWGASGSGATNTSANFSGSGILNVNNEAAPNSSTNSLARVMNAAYAPGLQINGTGSAWSQLASSTLYMDTTPNSMLTNNNLGVNIRYAWDYTNLYVLVTENTNLVTSTNEVEAPDATTYQSGPWEFDGIAFYVDLSNTCGWVNHGVEIAKPNADFEPWFGFSSAALTNIDYARANDTTTEDLAGLTNATVYTSGSFAAHNRTIEIAMKWADIAADVATNAQPGGSIAASVAPGLKIGCEPLLINNNYNGQSFIGVGNKYNPPSGADTNSVDVQLISLTTPPTLTITLESGQAVLRWPAAALGYNLSISPVLGAAASWTAVGTAPVADIDNPGMLKVSLPPSALTAFYRLQQ